MFIEVRGKIYTFYDHAVARMQIRNISFEWIEAALLEPDDMIELTPTRQAYDKTMDDERTIRVVVDEESSQIVTVYLVEAE